MQILVIDRADPHELSAREGRALPPHQSPARLAEPVCHGLSRGSRNVLSPNGEIVLATDVADVLVVHGKVGREHAVADFATVRAVAEEGRDEAGLLEWLSSQESAPAHAAVEAAPKRDKRRTITICT